MTRFFDITFSGLALLVLLPLFVFVIFILRFTGEGEIFFLQERVGKKGKVFNLFKFATMLKDSPNIGTGTVTMKDDVRVLPVGKFLRKAKINELPQLLNIFLGDMSVTGPRPLTIKSFNLYSPSIQNIIKQVKPGLSGIGSIVFRSEEELMHGDSAFDLYNYVISPYKGSLEEWFVSKKGLNIYFILIFMTIWVIVFPNTNKIWKVFNDLPKPPAELEQALNYPY